jgi:hypothetical protein
MALVQLIYVSTAREELDTAELDQILASSVRHNEQQQVTGMLLYSAGSFLQILEGEEAVVAETYSRIKEDPRHTDIMLLERSVVTTRDFAHWHMGFRRLGQADAADHPAYAAFFEHGFDAAAIGAKPGLALELLLDFGRRERFGV